jgi:hypothetical protein
MKRYILISLNLLFVAALLPTGQASSDVKHSEAAVLVCSASGTDPVLVQNYTGSAGAPTTINPGVTTCPDAIATLLTKGFVLKAVHPGDLRGGFYVFTKP